MDGPPPPGSPRGRGHEAEPQRGRGGRHAKEAGELPVIPGPGGGRGIVLGTAGQRNDTYLY